jgi:hypothetical protein
MTKNIDMMPEVFRSNKDTSPGISRAVKANTVRKIGPNLYTGNMEDSPEAIVRRNLWPVVAMLAPGAVVSFRTAFENRPAPDGSVFLTGEYRRQIALPGVTIRQAKGPGPVEHDTPFMGSLYLASRPRAFMENLLPARQHGMAAKSVGREDVERRLADILRVGSETALNKIRDQARAVAPALDLLDQSKILDSIIAGLLRSHPTDLSAPAARAYAEGEPYDPARLPVLEALFAALRSADFPNRHDRFVSPPGFFNAAFFDAYFSNYIEGTDFPVDQAMRIVFDAEIPENRPEDAHDVLGTYRLVSSKSEMGARPTTFDEFLPLLKRRHAVIMEGRPSRLPGQFKDRPNQAGSTFFVAPELVAGTLRQGHRMYEALNEPFARALFMMFLVAEVHPFMDGNGRMARVMMNAELVSQGQTRILIPSVYRGEYIGSLKALTNNNNPEAFLRVMSFAQEFVHRIDFSSIDRAREELAACNAFLDPSDEIKLRMPPPAP